MLETLLHVYSTENTRSVCVVGMNHLFILISSQLQANWILELLRQMSRGVSSLYVCLFVVSFPVEYDNTTLSHGLFDEQLDHDNCI